MFLDARKHLTTIEGISGSQDTTMIITGAGKPDRYLGAAIQADAFQMFGVVPAVGRWFRVEENEASAEPVVILGHDLWQQRYAANPGVVGKTVEVNGMMATIIGVMPKGWRFPHEADLWMPLRFDEKKETRGQFFLNPIGRLKPGVTLEQANVELARFAEMEAREHPDVNKGSTVRAVPMREALARDAKDPHASSDGRGALRSPNRVRQCCESFARARRHANKRVWHSYRSGCEPQSSR